MTLTLPDVPGLKEDQILLELACGLYASRRVSCSVAAEIASMDIQLFKGELERRSISNGYKPIDLEADLNALEKILGS